VGSAFNADGNANEDINAKEARSCRFIDQEFQ